MEREITFVAVAVLTVALMPASFGLRRLWRGEASVYDRPPPWWFYSDGTWRGAVRTLPAGGLTAVFGTVLGWLVVAYPDRSAIDAMPDAARAVFVGCVVGAVIGFLLLLSTFLFALPKQLIPPKLRIHYAGADRRGIGRGLATSTAPRSPRRRQLDLRHHRARCRGLRSPTSCRSADTVYTTGQIGVPVDYAVSVEHEVRRRASPAPAEAAGNLGTNKC